MGTFAQKPETTQLATSAKASTVIRARVGQGRDPNSILNLQRTMGNQALLRLLQSNAEERNALLTGTTSPHCGHDFSRIPVTAPKAGAIQTKLAINKPGDEYEQEADRVAEQVMRTPESKVQRSCACGGECPTCRSEVKQLGPRQALVHAGIAQGSAPGVSVTPLIVRDVIRSSGRPVDPSIRAFFEPRFGHGFSGVRIHTDARASDAAQAMNANAFTVGRDIVFREDQYVPETNSGRSLLAHELAHVVQQSRNGRDHAIQRQTAPTETMPEATQETTQERLERQRRESLEVLSKIVASADVEGFSEVVLTVVHDGRELAPGFEKKERKNERPSGMLPRQISTIQSELSPWFNQIVSQGKGRYVIHYTRDQQKRLSLMSFAFEPPSPVPPKGMSLSPQRVPEGLSVEDEAEQVFRLMNPMALTSTPGAQGALTGAGVKVTGEVGIKILKNLSEGKVPFNPELGKGGASWFVSEGNPYTGTSAAKNVDLPVEIKKGGNQVRFDETALLRLFEQQKNRLDMNALERGYRQYKGVPEGQPLNAKQREGFARLVEKTAESRMWDEVGKIVRNSSEKVGEVVLKNSRFSRSGDGAFLVVADGSKIQIKGGIEAVVRALETSGHGVEPVVLEAATKLATRMKWAGRVRAGFRYGGRILLVLAVAADTFYIHQATDQKKAVVSVAGGWVGATAMASAFATWFTPADVAGPWAWAAHGVGTLIAGGIGYWVGSKTTSTIYELVAAP